jgi:hypothetical protein
VALIRSFAIIAGFVAVGVASGCGVPTTQPPDSRRASGGETPVEISGTINLQDGCLVLDGAKWGKNRSEVRMVVAAPRNWRITDLGVDIDNAAFSWGSQVSFDGAIREVGSLADPVAALGQKCMATSMLIAAVAEEP